MRHLVRLGLLASLAAMAACTQLPAPTLTPPGPLSVGVGESVAFTAAPMPAGTVWTVDGIVGGSVLLGSVSANGLYTAPARVPYGAVVEVGARDAAAPSRTASAEVTVTANGTLYVYDVVIYAYGGMDAVDGNVAPDRTFVLDAVTEDVYDMAIAPAADTAFIAVQRNSPMIFRVPSISTADGTVTAFTTFDDGGFSDPSGVVYDPVRDMLYVHLDGGLLVYDGASTAPDGKLADREVSGSSLAGYVGEFDARLTLDVERDRLFVSTPDGRVSVYDDASTIDGEVLPDRSFTVDTPTLSYLWGAAYDAGRDELYLGDQRMGEAVYVVSDASTADGPVAPSRILGGPTHQLAKPSMLSYDPANDRLVVVLTGHAGGGVAIFDDASTVDGDVAPTRAIFGSELPISYPYGGYLDPTQ